MAMFEDVEESFIKMLANRVQRLFFLRGDFIIRKDDIGTDVYFIHKGRSPNLSYMSYIYRCN